MGKITNQEILTDPDCTPEPAKSVSTSRTGSHARDSVVTLRENPSILNESENTTSELFAIYIQNHCKPRIQLKVYLIVQILGNTYICNSKRFTDVVKRKHMKAI